MFRFKKKGGGLKFVGVRGLLHKGAIQYIKIKCSNNKSIHYVYKQITIIIYSYRKYFI